MNNQQAWDVAEVRIGSAVRGNSGPRQGVARTNAEINAAKRTGAVVSTDKKSGGTNASKGKPSANQRMTMVDLNDGIVKPKTVGSTVGLAIIKARNELGLTRKQLAATCFITETLLGQMEAGSAAPDQKALGALERALKTKLRGVDIGKKSAAAAPAKGKKGNKAKEEKGNKADKGNAPEEKPEVNGAEQEKAGPQPVEGECAPEEVKADGKAA